MALEKAYDMAERVVLWHVLRMNDVGGKQLLDNINSYVCVEVKRVENELFRIVNTGRPGCVMPPWFLVAMKNFFRFSEQGRER